jgi:hypothetical protein
LKPDHKTAMCSIVATSLDNSPSSGHGLWPIPDL